VHSFLGERFATPRGTVFGIWFVPGIGAFALVAIIVALSGTTTIATVPITGTVVVTVVAHLVSLPCLLGAGPRAFGPIVIRIKTLALAAVRYTSRAPTAIASIPITSAVVVFVVALPVTLVRSDLAIAVASLFEFRFPLVVSLAAFAFCAELVRIFATVCAAAVATIPVASANVVAIVTYLVVDPFWLGTVALTARWRLFRVETFAFTAQGILVSFATAITSIP